MTAGPSIEQARRRVRQMQSDAVKRARTNGSDQPTPSLGEWDAGVHDYNVAPREWLLENLFCRRFVSAVIADGGVGKTALRIAQALSLASGRPLTGERVFGRCKVLLASLEDDSDEISRRLKAAMIHHNIDAADLAGWLYVATPRGLVLAEMRDGAIQSGELEPALRSAIKTHDIAVVMLDPLIRAHRVEENNNGAMDFVMTLLAQVAIELNCAIDVSHHASKGASDPGNANRGRGASAVKDAARLVFTLSPMSSEEAQAFGIREEERRHLVRMDSGKVNVAPPMVDAKWFRLVGVNLGNATADYPAGDEVQTVECWTPPNIWAGLTYGIQQKILDEIDAGLSDGNRYSDAPRVTDRAAWRVVAKHVPDKTEGAARQIIKTWIRNGMLFRADYENPATRKAVKGLKVDPTKRP